MVFGLGQIDISHRCDASKIKPALGGFISNTLNLFTA